MTTTVTTWYLEQTSPADLVVARPLSAEADVLVGRATVPSPEFSRFLYTSVGGDNAWTDRLSWTYAQWQEALGQPGTETWVAYEKGTPAGYIELAGQADGVVEISYFGLLPAFRGRRIGGRLLSFGVERAWDLAERWPQRVPTKRVWVHTCSKDGEHALGTYERRGFRIYRTEAEEEAEPVNPGPWPGAYEPATHA